MAHFATYKPAPVHTYYMFYTYQTPTYALVLKFIPSFNIRTVLYMST